MHYSIINSQGLYYCSQGSESWYQQDCKGWAICSPDRQWVESVQPEFTTIIEMIQQANFTFIPNTED